ncbi:hypothetical protein OBRU01_19033, partial [Operophtera brumata]
LFILEEIVDRPPEFQMFLNLLRQVEPIMILLDGKTQGTFVQTVKRTVFDNDAQGRGYEACKRRIFTLSLPNEPSPCTDEERTMFLRTVVDFNHVQTVHALGALLRYLDLNWTNLSMNMQSRPQFLILRIISLADIVTIDEDTYRGLQIFSTVAHPSAFKKGMQGSNKEGLSLFQLFSKCSSKVGQSRMRIYLQHPSRDLATLKRRQDVVAFFMRPQNEPLMRNICSSLRVIKNVTMFSFIITLRLLCVYLQGILVKIKALSAKAYQWKSVYNTLRNTVLICEICENAGQSEFLEQLAACDRNKLHEMAVYMNRIIDFDLTKSEGKFTVKAGVDPELDMKKQTMASLHSLMSETAKVELSRLPDFIQECSMLYMPHLGYLLGVKAWAEHLTMEQKELPNMKFMFQNYNYIHYKSKGCEELDVMIGDTYPEIVAHETRIMMRLTTVILENLHTLAAIIDNIKQGRHPLHIVTSDNFVPNDVESSEQAGCMQIITGPNSSGKSVYMKMIGLIVYLAHIGSFVPAESATVGVISHIHSRIQSAECFGKGTAKADGLALLAASLNALLFREQACPHVLVSTHYLNIKEFIFNTPRVSFLGATECSFVLAVAAAHGIAASVVARAHAVMDSMRYVLQDDEPVFLFRVHEGATECSFVLAVAAAHGIVDDVGMASVVARAHAVMDSMRNNTVPPPNKKITSKLKARTEAIKKYLLNDDI